MQQDDFATMAGVMQLGGKRARGVFIAVEQDGDGAFRCAGAGDGSTDAGGTAADENGFVL